MNFRKEIRIEQLTNQNIRLETRLDELEKMLYAQNPTPEEAEGYNKKHPHHPLKKH